MTKRNIYTVSVSGKFLYFYKYDEESNRFSCLDMNNRILVDNIEYRNLKLVLHEEYEKIISEEEYKKLRLLIELEK